MHAQENKFGSEDIDLLTVDPSTLADIEDVVLVEGLSPEARLRSFLEQIKNPNCFRCGKIIVKCTYAEEE